MDNKKEPFQSFNEFQKRNSLSRDFHEAFSPQAEPMFNVWKLREAWDYYKYRATGPDYSERFFHWLERLEKDVPFDQQKYQP